MKTDGKNVVVEVVYKDPEGKELVAYRTLNEVLENSADEILEQCEQPCRGGSCFNESQNHCDCGGEYEDYGFDKIVIDTGQFKQNWVMASDRTPMCYESGGWDGLRSDFVACVDDKGIPHIARVYEGFLDGSEFRDWYGEFDYEISNVVKWTYLPQP